VTAPATAVANVAAEGIAIRTSGLTKRFGSILALDDLDLEVPAGTVFGLLGPNGAGKTTTIRLLTGLARPSSGGATVAGVDIRSGGGARAELQRRVGVLDQDPHFYGWMTGRELLTFVADLVGLRGPELRSRVEETLERIGLADDADRRISAYSGGMRQRLGIGQAIVGQPQLLILDEPVSSLDPEGRRDLLELIAELRDVATVVLSSHVLSDVERVCERVAILDRGRLVVESSISELVDRYAPATYHVEFDAGQERGVAAIVDAIDRERWSSAVERLGNGLRIHISDPSLAAMRLLPLLAASGLRVAAFERDRATLEDVFLSLVGHDEVDADGDGEDADSRLEAEAATPHATEPAGSASTAGPEA
jgi:ABC-2 type transport system ATP-binding protein